MTQQVGYDNVPEAIKRLTRSERIRWHRQRIQRERHAHTLLDELSTGLTEDQLVHSLSRVKQQRQEVENALRLVQSVKFTGLRCQLSSLAQVIRSVITQEFHYLKSRCRTKGMRALNMHGQALDALRTKKEALIDEALEVEVCIQDECAAYQVDPMQFLVICRLEGRV